jgi:cytoskeleton protein RodZ
MRCSRRPALGFFIGVNDMQASDHSLGLYLRSVREQQGIDLKDIVLWTKIQPKFIEAIEADDYKQLPKGPFVIGFLRSYAECLSLDADEVVAFFQAHYSRRMQGPPVTQQQRASPQRPVSASRASWQRRLLLSVVGLAVLVFVLAWFLQKGPWEQHVLRERLASTAVDKPPAVRQTVSAPVGFPSPSMSQETIVSHTTTAPPLIPPATSIGTEPLATASRQSEAVPPDTPGQTLSERSTLEHPPLVLRVQAQEETWMRLEIDDEARQEVLIKAGQSIEWKANKQFSLTIGNVKGARVLLNDQELDLPATRSNVLRDYVLTHALLNPRRTD